jgi:SOS response regulatory protein OraA/RecX
MLTLTNIKTSRVPNRVNLVFSDQSYLPFFIDDVFKLSLVKNQSIDPEKLNLIIGASLKYLGREYALRQIGISPKAEKILAQKLKQFFFRTTQKFKLFLDFPISPIINEIISELKDRNLLKSSDFVTYFVNKNKSKSKSQIKFLLNQQGIAFDSSVSDHFSPGSDLIAIQKILSKKKITKEILSDFNSKNKLFASLFRRGFQLSDIKAAIDDYLRLQ